MFIHAASNASTTALELHSDALDENEVIDELPGTSFLRQPAAASLSLRLETRLRGLSASESL